MKKILVGLLALGSISAFSQSIDWSKVAEKSEAMADMQVCFERVLKSDLFISDCADEVTRAKDLGVTKSELSTILYEVAVYRVMATKAAMQTDKEIKAEVENLLNNDNIESMILKN